MRNYKNDIMHVLLCIILLLTCTVQSLSQSSKFQKIKDAAIESIVSQIHNGHEYVDLGLSVMWATCNVGAESPEDYGDYFAWGEIETKSTYNERTYKCKKFSDLELPPYHDAAYANWRSTWRMPTDDEWAELCEKCRWTWITEKGVNGYNVTSKINGNSIFLPAAGIRFFETHRDRGPYDVGEYGNYWSKSRLQVYKNEATQLQFNSRGASVHFYAFRDFGFSVRPVFSPE